MRGRLDAAAGGSEPLLAVTLPVVIRQRADREAARAYLKPYLRTPTYQASWQLQGFEPADWEMPGSDRLVDAMVAIGTVDQVRDRIGAMVSAGADHVAIIPLMADGATEHLPTLEVLAGP
jgi:alkanesulfonate monooxygenase SsuD/methylene tetrahydromethanopterin reductase-like flavin-dependent oxidoreductase (luciferase family)